jgi:hypothetical protein
VKLKDGDDVEQGPPRNVLVGSRGHLCVAPVFDDGGEDGDCASRRRTILSTMWNWLHSVTCSKILVDPLFDGSLLVGGSREKEGGEVEESVGGTDSEQVEDVYVENVTLFTFSTIT